MLDTSSRITMAECIGCIHSFICATCIYCLLDSEDYSRSENVMVNCNDVS